jgi:NAD(P)-dependent dehydrogenase (short-subunit alcohol dehydrogenase family)
MAETTTVVVGGDRGIGRDLAAAMGTSGRRVVVLADATVDLTDPSAVRTALDAAAAAAPVTTLVMAHLDPAAFAATPLVELSETEWDDAAERSLRAAFVVLQQVHAVVPDGARVVLVLPTVAASGAAGLVPLCTAVEGIRVMAKAVARMPSPDAGGLGASPSTPSRSTSTPSCSVAATGTEGRRTASLPSPSSARPPWLPVRPSPTWSG